MDTNTVGQKYDTGKPQFGLIPPNALQEVARVMTYGAQKYARDNWRNVPDADFRYFNAAQRHMWATQMNEPIDSETGLHHEAHAICCLLFILQKKLESENANLSSTTGPATV